MKINCLSCGHSVELDDAYDDFEGQVKCFACGALLQVTLSEGCIRSVGVAATKGNRTARGGTKWKAKPTATVESTSTL